jgi:hypothetical protein
MFLTDFGSDALLLEDPVLIGPVPQLQHLTKGTSIVTDPGSGAFLTPRIWDPGRGVKIKNPRSGSVMSIQDQTSESLDTILWVKILKFFDPESFRPWIRDLGWKNRIRDPQHWVQRIFLSL